MAHIDKSKISSAKRNKKFALVLAIAAIAIGSIGLIIGLVVFYMNAQVVQEAVVQVNATYQNTRGGLREGIQCVQCSYEFDRSIVGLHLGDPSCEVQK